MEWVGRQTSKLAWEVRSEQEWMECGWTAVNGMPAEIVDLLYIRSQQYLTREMRIGRSGTLDAMCCLERSRYIYLFFFSWAKLSLTCAIWNCPSQLAQSSWCHQNGRPQDLGLPLWRNMRRWQSDGQSGPVQHLSVSGVAILVETNAKRSAHPQSFTGQAKRTGIFLLTYSLLSLPSPWFLVHLLDNPSALFVSCLVLSAVGDRKGKCSLSQFCQRGKEPSDQIDVC